MRHRSETVEPDPVLVAGLVRASYDRDLGEHRAFLPNRIPLDQLPLAFEVYLSACAELPARYPAKSGGVRTWLEREFRTTTPAVTQGLRRLNHAERDTLMTALSVLGHTYRWHCIPPGRDRFREQRISLPAGIAAPWSALARSCGQPRVGTTWSLHLCNWRMDGWRGGAEYDIADLTADKVQIVHNWLPQPFDMHLDRFSISFVLMEAQGAAILRYLVNAVEAAARCQLGDALISLTLLHGAIKAMTRTFSLTVRKATVNPAIWRELVQPTFPWSAEADEPGRIEGGPSGIQLGTIQALDAGLGVQGYSGLAKLAAAGRRYMPKSHRRFLETLDLAAPVIRSFIRRSECKNLTDQFNKCVEALGSFRTTHQRRGAKYLATGVSDDTNRVSTGLMVGVDDDAIATFERAMSVRVTETKAAMLPRSASVDAPA